LFISQPTVTVHIKQLEKEVGAVLFKRDGRKVILTEEGRRYLVHAKKMLALHEEGIQDLHSFQQGYTSLLTLGISPLIADTILPFVLKQFIQTHPQIEISVKIIESIKIEKAVEAEEVHIGLSCLPNRETNLKCLPLYDDPLVLVIPHDGFDEESALPVDDEEVLKSRVLNESRTSGYRNWREAVELNREILNRPLMKNEVRFNSLKKSVEELAEEVVALIAVAMSSSSRLSAEGIPRNRRVR
jgi:LysR family transcriptional regulator, repressor for citA